MFRFLLSESYNTTRVFWLTFLRRWFRYKPGMFVPQRFDYDWRYLDAHVAWSNKADFPSILVTNTHKRAIRKETFILIAFIIRFCYNNNYCVLRFCFTISDFLMFGNWYVDTLASLWRNNDDKQSITTQDVLICRCQPYYLAVGSLSGHTWLAALKRHVRYAVIDVIVQFS